MANLDAVAAALARLSGDAAEPFPGPELWSEGARRLGEQRRVLFGRGAGAAIMVTLPSEAASNPQLVDSYVAAGMDCARVDSPTIRRRSGGRWSSRCGERRSATAGPAAS